jgi:hypothetical protein
MVYIGYIGGRGYLPVVSISSTGGLAAMRVE